MFSYLTRPHQTSYIVKKSAKKKETVQIVGFNPEVKNILSCRDYILDLEERIFNADFGDAFENEEQRTLWRSDWEVREGENKIDYLTLADPQQTTLKKMKKLPELPENPTYSIHLSTEEEENDKILEIRNLAAAVVLLKRGMQSKTKNLAQNSVLTRPLFFASRNEKKKSKKEKGDWKNTLFLQHKQWEASILRCKSAAALYLHIVHLDECIMWAKSPENIRCSVCRKKSDGENMLICDDCEKAFHIYCLKPKLKKIPKGDWYCPKCTQERKEAESPKKKRRSTAHFSDDDSDSDEEDFNPAKKRRAAKRVNYQE